MSVIHNIKKRPTLKHLAQRTVSFAAAGEIDHVGPGDLVNIEIFTPTGVTKVTLSGKDFLGRLVKRTAKKTGKKVLVLGF